RTTDPTVSKMSNDWRAQSLAPFQARTSFWGWGCRAGSGRKIRESFLKFRFTGFGGWIIFLPVRTRPGRGVFGPPVRVAMAGHGGRVRESLDRLRESPSRPRPRADTRQGRPGPAPRLGLRSAPRVPTPGPVVGRRDGRGRTRGVV